ncbi:MAG: hypothetical protein IH930_09895 [Proteobacteria bacterium]|nr:hypothetical protein [Pseudomonadota bacterium]
MRYLTIFAALLLACPPGSAETLTERRISSGDIGTLVFMAPEKWKGVAGYDDLEAATVYELSSRREKFSLSIRIKNAGFEMQDDQVKMDELIIARLDGYLDYAMAEYVENSVEGEINATRFADRNHGIYARISDKSPGKDPFVYFTHGARVLDDKFIVFSLYSNDKDQSVMNRTLDVISSFRSVHEWADAPDSYLCKVEQLVGFDIVDEEWDAISSKKVKHSYVVRRSRPGDAFAGSSEWVFSAAGRENTNTFCDNESIAHGLFLCSGMDDEEFRMDSRTLRFLYVYLKGYYDVSPEAVPDEDSLKPQMEIGTCEAR